MAVSVIAKQPQVSFTNVSSTSVTLTATPVVGNKLFVLICNWLDVPGPANPTVTDTNSNSWAKRADAASNEERVTVWECDVATTGAGFQIDIAFDQAGTYGVFFVVEMAGMTTGDSFDQQVSAQANAASTTTMTTSGLARRGQDYEVAFAMLACTTQLAASNVLPPKGWDVLGVENNSPAILCVGASMKIFETDAPLEPVTWTHASSGTNCDVVMVALFKGDGTPPANPASPAFITALRRGIGAANSGR